MAMIYTTVGRFMFSLVCNNFNIQGFFFYLKIYLIRVCEVNNVCEIVRLKEDNELLRKENNDQNEKIRRIMRGLRARNVVFEGVEERQDEMNAENLVHKIIVEKLAIDCKYDDIACAERLGSQGNYSRPIHVRFRNESIRNIVMKNRKKLKGSTIFIDEDFTPEVREERRMLREILKKEKQAGQNGYIKYDKLIIDNESHTAKDINKATMTLNKTVSGKRQTDCMRHKRIRSDDGEENEEVYLDLEEKFTKINRKKNMRTEGDQQLMTTFLKQGFCRKNSI